MILAHIYLALQFFFTASIQCPTDHILLENPWSYIVR